MKARGVVIALACAAAFALLLAWAGARGLFHGGGPFRALESHARDSTGRRIAGAPAVTASAAHANPKAQKPSPGVNANPERQKTSALSPGPKGSQTDWEQMPITRESDPALGSGAQRNALSAQLRKEFYRITDTCFSEWKPPRSLSGSDGIVPVRIAIALGVSSLSGTVRVEYASVERANFSDSDLERCLVAQAVGSSLTLPTDYREPTGGLRSLPPLGDGSFRIWYPLAIGVPSSWAVRERRH